MQKQKQKQVDQRKKIQLSNQKQRDMQTKLQTKQREFQRKETLEKQKILRKGITEDVELDEVWTKDIAAKISQVSHPRGWEEMVLQFVKGMKNPEHKKHPSALAAEIANSVKGVSGRQLIKYINKLIDKGVLPQDLKASYLSLIHI